MIASEFAKVWAARATLLVTGSGKISPMTKEAVFGKVADAIDAARAQGFREGMENAAVIVYQRMQNGDVLRDLEYAIARLPRVKP